VVHVRVERFDVSSEKEPVRVYGLVLDFINKVEGVFNIRRMFIGVRL